MTIAVKILSIEYFYHEMALKLNMLWYGMDIHALTPQCDLLINSETEMAFVTTFSSV
jgi:hypothetical protein